MSSMEPYSSTDTIILGGAGGKFVITDSNEGTKVEWFDENGFELESVLRDALTSTSIGILCKVVKELYDSDYFYELLTQDGDFHEVLRKVVISCR